MKEVSDSRLGIVEETGGVVLGGFDDQRNVLAQACGGPFLGFVHGVVDEVLLVGAEPVRTLVAPLRELTKELGSLVLLDDVGLVMED